MTTEPATTKTPKWLLAILTALIGLALPFVLAEIVLRFLPVHGGVFAEPVNAKAPVFRFQRNRTITWSRDRDFSIVNRVTFNNEGFVNDQRYDEKDPRPLLAVVGDSYIEALMTPYAETIQGRLAKELAPNRRVYSFAASGAPLSQYLAWAKEAKERWKADTLVIAVIANDFDESLAAYKRGPGFHHYEPDGAGNLRLVRVDYTPGLISRIVKYSALARYALWNLQAVEHIKAYLERQRAAGLIIGTAHAQTYVGNTAAAASATWAG